MKKIFKSRIFIAIITAIICITGTAYAATQILAGDIKYKNSTVESALDDLYTTASDYVKLDNETTVSTANLLSGITAYDNLGNLITGTLTTNTYATTLVVHGSNGTMSELNLKNNTFTKFKYSDMACSNGNTATVYTYDNTFGVRNNIQENTVYDANNTYYRIFIQKTGGNDWCQIQLTFSN